MRMPPSALDAILVPAGFDPHDLVELPPYHYGAVYRRGPRAGAQGSAG
jgi:hypothetical protein